MATTHDRPIGSMSLEGADDLLDHGLNTAGFDPDGVTLVLSWHRSHIQTGLWLLGVVVAIHAAELLQVRDLGIVGQLQRVGVALAGAAALVQLARICIASYGLKKECLGRRNLFFGVGLRPSELVVVKQPPTPTADDHPHSSGLC
ncbi:hypothetical protein IFM58399_09979 [Aspergillus lentulus]|uniref:uncharacterized protein n=1 Tax=Aspergillus lentulus TaxID=293939 RepID=UPI001394CF0C|nr:uncharacterized protein IFM58399_09979 [Aspergillus lentulus]GFF55056.1 hypothetical protein IFM58399_09979 [Aspergillus lentulus]